MFGSELPSYTFMCESNGAAAGDGALVHLTSCGTLVILITSSGEFCFIILFGIFTVSFF